MKSLHRLIAVFVVTFAVSTAACATARAQSSEPDRLPPAPEASALGEVSPVGGSFLATAPPLVLQPHLYAGGGEDWDWQLLPEGLIYRSYLAGAKESRMSGKVVHIPGDSTIWDSTLGGRFGLVRYGTRDPFWPEGWQIDVEGSAQVRLDIMEEVDVRSVDFRAGLPITYGVGNHQWKFAYYHLSSHLGDEFMLKNPTFERKNFSRDVLVIGHSVYLTPDVRVYAEAGWAFFTRESKPWEFQFGLDYAPACPTGHWGAPFFAINGHLREEVNWGGNLTAQIGWAWRSEQNGRLLRLGLQYYNGESSQFSFFDEHEEQIGFGIWYDY